MSPIERTTQFTNPLPLACPPHAAHSHWRSRTATARVYPSSYSIFGQHEFQQNWVSRDSHNFSLSPSLSFSPTPTCMHILERLGLAHFSFFHNSHSFNSLSSIKKTTNKQKILQDTGKKALTSVCMLRYAGPSSPACGCSTHTQSRPDSWGAPKPPAAVLPGLQAWVISRSTDYSVPFWTVVLNLGAH